MTYVKSPWAAFGTRSVLLLRSIIPPSGPFRRVCRPAPEPVSPHPPALRRAPGPACGQCLPAFGPQVVSTAASTMVATAYSTMELMTAKTTIVQTPP